MARTQPRKLFTGDDLQKFEVNLNNLEIAVNKLFKNSVNSVHTDNGVSNALQTDQDFAHQWLMWVQKSSDAWQMIWYLLNITPPNDQTRQHAVDAPSFTFSPELQYFGANTLQFKIQKQLNDLTSDEVVTVRDKLMNLITQAAPGMRESSLPKFVYTRLLISLASLIIRTVGEGNQLETIVWGSSGDPVGQLVSLFSNGQMLQTLNAHYRLNILLQLLTFIPEEYATSFLSKRMRNCVHHYCSNVAMPCVLNLVMTFLKVPSTSSEQKCSVLNVINAWCQFGISLSENVELLQLLYSHLVTTQGGVSAVTEDGDNNGGNISGGSNGTGSNNHCIISEIFNCLTHLIGQPASSKCQLTFFQLLLPTTVTSLSTLISKILEDGEENTVNAACSYLLSIGDTYTNSIVLPMIDSSLSENCARCVSLCEMILKFTAKSGFYPVEETCSVLTFSFWYNLQEDLPVCLSAISENFPPETNQALTRHCTNIMTILNQLVIVLCRKCQYPSEEVTKQWTSDEIEQLRCYRIDCNDYIASLQSLLGVTSVAHTLSQLYFVALSQSCNMISTTMNTNIPWQTIEAPLFLLSGCNTLGEVDDCYLIATPVLTSLPRIMCSHPKIMESCCDLIGQLAMWMCEQSAMELELDSTILFSVINALTSSLTLDENVSSHAAMALKEIAAASVSELHPLAENIFHKVKPLLYMNELPKLSLLENLVYTVGKSISAMNNKQILNIAEEILKPHTEKLLKFINSGSCDSSSTDRNQHSEDLMMEEIRTQAVCSAAHIWLSLATQLVASIDCGCVDEGDDGDCCWVRPGDEVDACIVLLQEVDPVVKLLMEQFSTKEVVVNDVCSLYKRAYFNIRHRISPVSSHICFYAMKFLSTPSDGLNHPTSLLHILTTQNILPDVETTKSVIEQSYAIIISNYFTFESSSSSSLSLSSVDPHLCTSSQQNHYTDPDFLAEFFYWLLDLLKERESSRLFEHSIASNTNLLTGVFKIMLKSLMRQESLAFRNCMAALTEFIKLSVSVASSVHLEMQQCCLNGMDFIMEHICDVLTGISLNVNGLDTYGSLLQQLSKSYPKALETSLKTVLSRNKYVSSTQCSESERTYFISNVLKEKFSKSNMRDLCNSFHVSCVGSQTNTLLV